MATVLHRPKENAADSTLPGRKTAPKNSTKESYVIYSIYYTDEPEGGHVVYSKHQSGWEFFGYLPAKQPALITEPVHRRIDVELL